jgi:hypothetical protein
MKPKSTDLTREEAAAIRRLGAELGVEAPGKGAMGFFVGAALASALSLAALAFWFSGGPPTLVYGTVQGFGLRESQYGSLPLIRVWVDDRNATVPVSLSATCAAGDRIKLYRRRALLGYRYSPGFPRPCS